MKPIKKSIFFLLCCLLLSRTGFPADSQSISWNSTTGTTNGNIINVDNDGGYDSDYRYTFNSLGFTSSTNLIISDGSNIDHADFDVDGDDLRDFDYDNTEINIFTDPTSTAFTSVDYLFAVSTDPLVPIGFTGLNTGFTVKQLAYVEADSDFVIFEFNVTNTGSTTNPIYIAITNDWDAAGETSNTSDYVSEKNLIYQTNPSADTTDDRVDNPDSSYSVGLASLINGIDQYRLGYCCEISDQTDDYFSDPYALVKGFILASQTDEECDDDNTTNGDKCSADCKIEPVGISPVCGDSIVNLGETCDDGNMTAGDGCDSSCLLETCGNGTLDSGEECDDDSFYYCSKFCTYKYPGSSCGDGIINNGGTGVQTDPANLPDDIESNLSIKFTDVAAGESRTGAFCLVAGKGTIGTDESVTDLETKIDACLAYYTTNIAICGNGVQNAGEGCDDGNLTDGDGCDSDCDPVSSVTEPVCGNGDVETGEECDDGNTTSGDDCSSTCEDEGSGGGGGGGGGDGSVVECGNATVDTGEECDDGNTTNGDGCSSTCTEESSTTVGVCGDGTVDSGEECDDGNTTDGDGCSATCVDETPASETASGGGGCSLATQPVATTSVLATMALGLGWLLAARVRKFY